MPLATYTVGHRELAAAGWTSVAGAIVVGGCLFSAITVYKWGERAFGSALKATGFVVLSEGVMTFSQTPWLSLLVLGFLIAINAVANGANLAVAHLDAEARRRAAQVAIAALVEAPSPAALVAPAVVAAPAPVAILELATTPVESEPASAPEQAVKPASARRRSASKIKTVRGARRASTAMLN